MNKLNYFVAAPSESGDEASSSDSSARLSQSGKVPFKRLDLGRDSGCYASSNEQGAAAAAEKVTPEPEKRPLEAPRSANASPRLRSASAAVASALAAASMAAAQSKEKQQVPRTPSYDFRAEYDKLKGKLEASLTKLPLAADGQKLPPPLAGESAVAAGIRCFSEKSSDSGVSSSSRSPPPPVAQTSPSLAPKPEKQPPLA